MIHRCEDESLEHTSGVYVVYGTCPFCMGEGCEHCDLSGGYERLEFEDVREAERAELLRLEAEPVWVERLAA